MNYWDELVTDCDVQQLRVFWDEAPDTAETTEVFGSLATGKYFIMSIRRDSAVLALTESSSDNQARFAQEPLDLEPHASVDYETYTESFNRLYPAALEILLGTEPDCG